MGISFWTLVPRLPTRKNWKAEAVRRSVSGKFRRVSSILFSSFWMFQVSSGNLPISTLSLCPYTPPSTHFLGVRSLSHCTILYSRPPKRGKCLKECLMPQLLGAPFPVCWLVVFSVQVASCASFWEACFARDSLDSGWAWFLELTAWVPCYETFMLNHPMIHHNTLNPAELADASLQCHYMLTFC